MASLVKTVMVVDQTGKAVSTSKQLINVFKEAKNAYRERKAEIVAGRQIELEEKRARRALKAHNSDAHSVASSRRSSTSKHTRRRPAPEHHHTTGSVTTRSIPPSPLSPRSFSYDMEGNLMTRQELARRHTDHENGFTPPMTPTRALTTPTTFDEIDMDLAYGEMPPPLPLAKVDEEAELKGLINKVKMLLEEAECLQYSASATIANLQKNPDAMAAVALTLAEISNIASKMAPGALIAMKGSAPAVFALLASPQFLIAGGVAVGVTVVALGGYKIIKKIKANHAAKAEAGMDEMLEISGDVSRIDNWRRGIAEVEAQSVGTSVDGEFITPQAAALSRLDLNGSVIHGTPKDKEKKQKSKKTSSKSVSSKDSKSNEKSKHGKKDKQEKVEKERKPSTLRLMFRGESA